MEIEGAPVKRFRVYYCDINNEPHECEGEYDTIDQLNAHRWRLDRRYKIAVGGKFLTRTEFAAWVKQQPQ
ncbi:MAG: hypothetical protein WA624_00910 [Methylocella sp.]